MTISATREAQAHVAVRIELNRLRKLAEETPLAITGWRCGACDHGGTDVRDAIAHEDAHAQLARLAPETEADLGCSDPENPNHRYLDCRTLGCAP